MGYREVVLADSPVWYSRLGESSGTTATDEVAAFNGTYVNTPTLGATGALLADANTAVTLAAASTEHITIPDDAKFDFGTGDWSLEIWVKQAANGQTSDWFFSKGGQFSLFLNSSGKLKTDNFTGTWSVTSDSAVNGDTNWHHYVATRSGSTFTLYKDGSSIPATESGTVNLAANSTGVFIGVESSGSNPFNGSIDEPAIYNTALSAAQVLAHYTAGKTVFVTPTTAALTLATFAPTVTSTANQTVTPSTASLTTATFAPTVTASDHKTATPSTASLTLATFAPTVAVSDNKSVTPDTAALTLTTFAPTVTATANQTVTPDTATLTLTTFAPTVSTSGNQVVTPGVASLSMTAFAPSVVITDHKVVTPDPASLSLTAFAPTVTASDHKTVTPSTASLSLTAFAPTVTAEAAFDWAHATSTVTLSAVAGATVTVNEPDAATVSISSSGSGVVTI